MKRMMMSAAVTALVGGTILACAPQASDGSEEAMPPVEDETAAALPDPNDPRTGLAAGLYDAGEAAWNMELISLTPTPDAYSPPDSLWSPAAEIARARAMQAGEEVDRPPNPISFANTDLAFTGDNVVIGNWHGFYMLDVAVKEDPEVILQVVCPGGQGDVSVHGDLVFRSVEDGRARLDCGLEPAEGEVNAERFRGVQIFDISDLDNPRQVAAVQTCRGSHTHTIVPDLNDPGVIYIYNSGTAGVRSNEELDICSGGQPDENADTALYSIDVIRVPLDAPEQAEIINRPRIFADAETGEIAGLWSGGAAEEGAQRTATTNQCHDIQVYPEAGLAAGACSGNGLLLDISDPANPVRISDLFDSNMAYWHAAIFNNDADKIVFTDEWGGGLGARCTPDAPENWGANIIASIGEDGQLTRNAYYKIPNNQTEQENCVAHNGQLLPVPGRDIMVQSWYQGGISVFDFTDPDNPFEIAFFDRGPISEDELFLAGHWSAYWHNGLIYAPGIVRGLDILRLTPSEYLSEAEIHAASLVRFDEANTQTQLRYDWPADPMVAQAYLDQLARGGAVDAALLEQAGAAVSAWGAGEAGDMSGLVAVLTAAAGEASGEDADRLAALADVLAAG